MNTMEIIGYILAFAVGISLGLIGGGGSILTLPILVYVMGIGPEQGTAYSLFIVGSTALFSGIQYAQQKKVDFKTALIFGLPAIASVYLTRAYIVPMIPDLVMSFGTFTLSKPLSFMLLFAVVMLFAAISMMKPSKQKEESIEKPIHYNYPMILTEGVLVGILTGIVGAGGGFLIIPALVLFARLPMKLAVGTSLIIIATKSLIGFIGDIQNRSDIDWKLIIIFSIISILGSFVGNRFAQSIDNAKLKKIFAWFVLVMGTYIILKELLFK
ncbi:MAG: sulfite exporter TauE/SafE family protein [Bacteroidia bacterium]|nr:sulfite exporter TauE/SafE family protein [Bacteroidia bacterium]